MDIRETLYFKQADLLLQVLPVISEINDFALKGGTAINLFVRDLPRLSVDIDLTFLPLNDRKITLETISKHLQKIARKCKRLYPDIHITTKQQHGLLYGLIIARRDTAIKIEPNTTIRGTVFPHSIRNLTPKAQDLFEKSIEIQTLSIEDLYGGKICAALDRQHPRDLYDIYFLLQHEGLTDKLRQAFIVYLLSHNRPISELLNPKLKDDLGETWRESFEGMAFIPVSLDLLIEAWFQIVHKIQKELTEKEKEFILSFKKRTPQWDLFPVNGIESLPAVKWKMLNLKNMGVSKHKRACKRLENIFSGK